jgi:hypothetical protein
MCCNLKHHCPQEFDECSKIIDQALENSQGKSEYALYVKALIERQQGDAVYHASTHKAA